MPPEPNATEGSWAFRTFLIFIALLICAFIGWLVWAMVEFSPTVEKDIAKSLLATPLFQRGDFAITNQPSACRSSGEVKGSVSAALFEAYTIANATETGDLELHRFRKERQVLDATRTPSQWYRELRRPVMSVSNVGVVDTQALVCLELFGASARGMFVTLEHAGADYWRMISNESAWVEEREPPPEEIPELTIPTVE